MRLNKPNKNGCFKVINLYCSIKSATYLIMANNEKTSKEIARIAGKILEMNNSRLITDDFWDEIKSVAASALTQVEDKQPLADSYLKGKLVKIPPAKRGFRLSDITKGMQNGFDKK